MRFSLKVFFKNELKNFTRFLLKLIRTLNYHLKKKRFFNQTFFDTKQNFRFLYYFSVVVLHLLQLTFYGVILNSYQVKFLK